MNKNAINKENTVFTHILKHQKKYLLGLTTLLLTLIPILNFFKSDTILMGSESYYLLANSKILQILISQIGEQSLILIPIILGIVTIYMLSQLIKNLKYSENFNFFFILLLITSPVFLYTYSSLNTSAFYFTLLISGFFLLIQKNETQNYFALIPFISATFFDLFSSLIVILSLTIYYITRKNKISTLLLTTTSLASLVNLIVKQRIILGPFHIQRIAGDLISDLGGLSGISFFVILLATIGLLITWRKKKNYLAYLFIPLIVPAYIYSTQTIFMTSLLIIFFASFGLVKLFERKWTLVTIKQFTFFLLLLGILFSSMSYIERMHIFNPSEEIIEPLTWINENTGKNQIIFSAAENADYISYFSKHTPFYTLHDKNNINTQTQQEIINATYINDFIQLLNKGNISIIYLTPKMKEELQNTGFITLLKNERFKLIHSYKQAEVWIYKKIAS